MTTKITTEIIMLALAVLLTGMVYLLVRMLINPEIIFETAHYITGGVSGLFVYALVLKKAKNKE